MGPAPSIVINETPQRIENGKYLANHVTVCMDCHSDRDWSRFAAPMKTNSLGAGGEIFTHNMGFPGTYYAKNITPYGLKNWTDGEIFRAITTGVDKDGKALFPIMASHRFGQMDKEDIYDIIAYIKTLKPIQKDILNSASDFPVNFIINTMPREADFHTKPQATDTLKYGAYLVNAAGCVDCHSRTDKGNVIAGTEFGGGMEFKMPFGIVTSPNLTADLKTGIGSWTKDLFVSRFKIFADSNYKSPIVAKGEMNTVMPWTMYAGMKKGDLEAIYTYLRSIKPIQNSVDIFKSSLSKTK